MAGYLSRLFSGDTATYPARYDDEPLWGDDEWLADASDPESWRTPPWTRPMRPRPAAGVLPVHRDADGVLWLLLGLRAPVLGGTWSNLGGTLEPGETPFAGALREVWEETGVPASRFADSTVVATVECGTTEVPYTLFVLAMATPFYDGVLTWENDDLAWWPASSVPDLDLHAGFRRALANIAL